MDKMQNVYLTTVRHELRHDFTNKNIALFCYRQMCMMCYTIKKLTVINCFENIFIKYLYLFSLKTQNF